MKILIVAPTFYPDVNGASYFVQRLAHYMHERGHNIQVIAPSRYIHNESYDLDGVAVFGVRSYPTFINKFRIAIPLGIDKMVKEKIKEFGPDIINIQSHFIFSKAALEAARELNVPIIGTNHFMPENLTHYLHFSEKAEAMVKRHLWNNFLKIFENVDAVTTPTLTGAKLLASIGLKKSVTPISCGIDLRIYNEKNNGEYLKRKYNLPNKPILLYLGRLDTEKNVDVLLRAFALALKKVDMHFVIAGIGAEAHKLKELTTELNIEQSVSFVGFVSDKDEPYLYAIANCFAIAGVAELQSIVTMEAMATGLPVIAVNAMALPHLVKHNENGYLFELKNVDSIAGYIENIFTDKELRARMSRKSLEMIQEHDINRILDKYEALYKEQIDLKKVNRN